MRQRDRFRDPVGKGIVSAELGDNIELLLATLDADERAVLVLRFGLLDGVARTLDETAEALGTYSGWVFVTESQAIKKMRHPSRSVRVRHHLLDEIAAGVLDRAREEAMGRSGSEVVFCSRHGWVTRDAHVRLCESCPCRAGGRNAHPRRYCSDACRQAAYRARRNGVVAAGRESESGRS